MAMTKKEMQDHQIEYHALMDKARAAQQDGLFHKAVELALSSWDHIDGMMQYERKYEGREFVSIEGIDLVLKYAPLLLDFHGLDTLECLLRSRRRIEKDTTEDLGENLAKARLRMWEAHRMWDYLEQHGETRQDELRRSLGGDQEQWRSVAETWEEMGLLRRVPEGRSYRISLSTRMGEVVSGKCPSCGTVAEAPKAILLEKTTCPQCRVGVLFVLLPKEIVTAAKDDE